MVHQTLHPPTLSVGGQVYCLAVCRASLPTWRLADTLFAGCSRGAHLLVETQRAQRSGNNRRGEFASSLRQEDPRARATATCCSSATRQAECAHGTSPAVPAQGRSLDAHTAGVRAIDADPITNLSSPPATTDASRSGARPPLRRRRGFEQKSSLLREQEGIERAQSFYRGGAVHVKNGLLTH